MEKTLTADDFRSYGFTDNEFWKSITDDINLIVNPDTASSVQVKESHTDKYKWFVQIKTYGNTHRWGCEGHINTLSELERMYEYCELKPSWR